jgi:hypothetical protein
MARYVEMSLITSSVPAGEALTISQPISASHVNLVKLKVVPGVIGGTTRFQVYKRATFIDADNLYDTRDFEGSLIDPVLDYSDPMTDTPGATAERNEGPPIPYEDADGTSKLHIRIFNGDVNPKPYSVTAWYEIPVLVVGGVSTLSGIDILGPTPTLTFTDTTGPAPPPPEPKSMKIVVDSDKGYVTEKAAALGTLWTYDLVNLRAGLNTSAPCSLLANTSSAVIGSEGNSASPVGLTWMNTQAGWGACFGIDGVGGHYGMLLYCSPSGYLPLFKAESISYNNTLFVTGDGRVGIATVPTGAVLHINGDQRPSDAVFAAERTVTGAAICYFANTSGDDTATIYSVSYSPNYGPNISLVHVGTAAINLITSAKGSLVDMVARDFGASNPGCHVELGRNTNAGTPCAGYVNFINMNGSNGCVWMDAAGNLRIWGGPPSAGDTGGTVVGTQISVREGKDIVRPITPADRMTAVEHLIETPLYVYLLNNEVGAGFNHFHVGFIADEQPAWMMYDSNSIDEHRIEMELVIGFQDHELRLRALEEKELPTQLPRPE